MDIRYLVIATVILVLPVRADDTRVIWNLAANKVLDADVANIGHDACGVTLWGCSGKPNQVWYLKDAGDHSVAIINSADGKCLDEDMAHIGHDGCTVSLWGYVGKPNQRWVISDNHDGTVAIFNYQDRRRALDADAPNVHNNGCHVSMWGYIGKVNQKWLLTDPTSHPGFFCTVWHGITDHMGYPLPQTSSKASPPPVNTQHVSARGSSYLTIKNEDWDSVTVDVRVGNDAAPESNPWYEGGTWILPRHSSIVIQTSGEDVFYRRDADPSVRDGRRTVWTCFPLYGQEQQQTLVR